MGSHVIANSHGFLSHANSNLAGKADKTITNF
jgi:hypothetical protein